MSEARKFLPVGEPLAPAEAAYLLHEFEEHGIEARLRAAEASGAELVVEVRAPDLPAGVAMRHALLDGEVAPPEHPRRPDAGPRRRALLAAATGSVAVMYLGRALPAALRGVLALAVGAVVYLAVSARAARGHTNCKGPTDAET